MAVCRALPFLHRGDLFPSTFAFGRRRQQAFATLQCIQGHVGTSVPAQLSVCGHLFERSVIVVILVVSSQADGNTAQEVHEWYQGLTFCVLLAGLGSPLGGTSPEEENRVLLDFKNNLQNPV